MTKVEFAVIQMSMARSDKEANLSKAEELIERASRNYSPDIVGLPELFAREFFPVSKNRMYFDYAEHINDPSITRISRLARKYKEYILAPIFESYHGKFFDTSIIVSPQGKVIVKARKNERPAIDSKQNTEVRNENYEKFYFSYGRLNEVVKLDKCKLGQLMCDSRHFPKAWRSLELKGAEIIYIPLALNGGFPQDLFIVETRALAFMHQCFAVVINRTGKEGKYNYFGGSHIVDPFGKLLAGPAKSGERIIHAKLDLKQVKIARSKIPFLRDRRTDLYAF